MGAILLYKGRLNPDTLWEVVKITTDKGVGRGMKSVQEVNKLTDFLTVRNKGGETREMSFLYASYSAIWQLPRN